MKILALLTRQFRLLMEVKLLVSRGYARPKVAEVTGLHPYVAGKYMSQCKSFSGRDLRGIMEDAAEMEEAVKTGRLADTMCVELFIVKYSMKD